MEIKKNEIIAGVGFVLLAQLPLFLLGESSYVVEHDNLDSEIVYLQILKLSNNLLGWDGSAIVPNVFNGLPRSYFHSEYSFIRVLFYLLPSFWAYVFNSIIIRIVGLIGMLLLARDYISASGGRAEILFVAVIFTYLPIYSLYGISILGQPLMLWSFLNLHKERSVVVSMCIVILFPFYAHFAMVAPFILIAFCLLGGYYFWRNKASSWYWIGVGSLLFMFVLSNLSIITGFLFSDTVSHRSVWASAVLDVREMMVISVHTFFFGQYHAAYLVTIPAIFGVGYAIIKKTEYNFILITITLLIVVISLFNGIYPSLSAMFQNIAPILNAFQFNRLTVLIPILYFLLLLIFCQVKGIKKIFLYSLLGVQGILIVFSNKEITYNYAKIVFPQKERVKNMLSFQSYFAEHLFQEIDNYIKIPKENYRVVSIGLPPTIAQYNGFYTLDGYQNNYPLSYKTKFRKVIAGELAKSARLRQYFDGWGNRCYLFSAKLREDCYIDCDKMSKATLTNLSINVGQLRQMGGKYIFSAVPILNSSQLKIDLKKVFRDKTSEWIIYLYKIP